MLEYLKQEANKTVTENGAATHITTESDCLDLFATIGALRRESDSEIVTRFVRAYSENRDIAMKLLFFARDIRGGLGERRVFKVILNWLANNEPEAVRKNLAYVAEYGRYDDLLCLMNSACEKEMLDVLKKQFNADTEALVSGGEVSLLAKWLPSVNASNKETVLYAKKIARHFGMNDASYRKALFAHAFVSSRIICARRIIPSITQSRPQRRCINTARHLCATMPNATVALFIRCPPVR